MSNAAKKNITGEALVANDNNGEIFRWKDWLSIDAFTALRRLELQCTNMAQGVGCVMCLAWVCVMGMDHERSGAQAHVSGELCGA